jgi:pimeloyl-ACP methyl ester carboxylesterase
MVTFERIGDFDTFPVEFGRDGNALNDEQVNELIQAASSASDLLVLSHGWNNDEAEATELYRELLGNLGGMSSRRLIVLRVYWPSKRFAEEDLIPGGAASTDDPVQAVVAQVDNLLADLNRPGVLPDDEERRDALAAMKELLPRLEEDESASEAFVRLSRTLLSRRVNEEEDVLQDGFFGAEGAGVLQRLARKFKVRPQLNEGPAAAGVAAVGGDDEGGAAGFGNLFRGVLNGARNLLNLLTYFEMKERAGLVGSTGVADLMRQAIAANPKLRLHLCGHSFGGRLVTAAAAAFDAPADNSIGIRSITLLQAAFSHNGFGVKFDGKSNGFFRNVFDGRRLAGPVVVTHTERDRAVGLAYPIASRLRDQVASGIGDAQDPYGAIGRNGALFAPDEVDPAERGLRPLDQDYSPFSSRRIYNLHGGEFISEHSDVRGPQVAKALRHAIEAAP